MHPTNCQSIEDCTTVGSVAVWPGTGRSSYYLTASHPLRKGRNTLQGLHAVGSLMAHLAGLKRKQGGNASMDDKSPERRGPSWFCDAAHPRIEFHWYHQWFSSCVAMLVMALTFAWLDVDDW